MSVDRYYLDDGSFIATEWRDEAPSMRWDPRGDYVEYEEYEKLRDYLENLASTTPHKFLKDEIKELLK